MLQSEFAENRITSGRRLMQRARGYKASLVSGEVVMQDDEPTGALPGRLIRGEQAAPA